jgi:hypothetical protein
MQLAMGLAGLTLAGAVAATPITIVNFSFENPIKADAGFSMDDVTGWVAIGLTGVFNPTTTQLPQGPTDGLQVAYSNNGNLSTAGLALTQDLTGTVLTAGTFYTLMVDVLSRPGGSSEKGSTLELRTSAGTLLASSSVGALTPGTNALLTTTFLAGLSDPNLGQTLEIRLLSNGAQSDWDNVRLDATARLDTSAVPESGTVFLLGLALAGLGVVRRKS